MRGYPDAALQDDDGFGLYESRAIVHCIVETYSANSGLIPRDPRARTRFEQAASVELSTLMRA
jgi:glutathione S-transferase